MDHSEPTKEQLTYSVKKPIDDPEISNRITADLKRNNWRKGLIVLCVLMVLIVWLVSEIPMK